jgi:hypothetical protein
MAVTHASISKYWKASQTGQALTAGARIQNWKRSRELVGEKGFQRDQHWQGINFWDRESLRAATIVGLFGLGFSCLLLLNAV